MVTSNKVATRENERKQKKRCPRRKMLNYKLITSNDITRLCTYFFKWFSVRSTYERNDILFVSETHFITNRARAWDIVINAIAVFLIQYHITWLSYVFDKNASPFFTLQFTNRMNDFDKMQHFPYKLNVHVTL